MEVIKKLLVLRIEDREHYREKVNLIADRRAMAKVIELLNESSKEYTRIIASDRFFLPGTNG